MRALRRWPEKGVPDDPAAWVFRVARNLALDALRQRAVRTRVEDELVRAALDTEPCRDPAEHADQIGDTPLLLLHGDTDHILPHMASEMVRMIAGTGELVILPGAGHLLTEAAVELRERLSSWVPERFADHVAAGKPAG